MADINLSGSVGSGGAFPILGSAVAEITGDTDLILTLPQYSNQFIQITSDGTSTGVRNVIAPLNKGTTFFVQNITSELFSVVFKGATGDGVVIPNSSQSCTVVATDGINYFEVTASGASLIVPNVTALKAVNVSGFEQDQLAVMQSVNAVWSYQPNGDLPTDNITIIAAFGEGTGQWWRSSELGIPEALLQTNWYVDPQNVTTTASDENDGLTNTTSLRTYAEIMRRWGGTGEPILNAPFLDIQFLSPHTDFFGSDPVVLSPLCTFNNDEVSTNVLRLHGVLDTTTEVAAGAITVTQAKADPDKLLTVTLPGPHDGRIYSRGNLVVNADHPSRALLDTEVSPNVWTISQPLTSYSPIYALGGGNVLEVNNWTTADNVHVYEMTAIDLVEFNPRPGTISPELDDFAFAFEMQVYDPTEAFSIITIGPFADFQDTWSQRLFQYTGDAANLANSNIVNTGCEAGIAGGTTFASGFTAGPQLLGGVYGDSTLEFAITFVRMTGCTLDLDVILRMNESTAPMTLGSCKLGLVYLAAESQVNVSGESIATAVRGGSNKIWGAGVVNVVGNARLVYSGLNAVGTFVNTGGLQINGVNTAFSVDDSADPAVLHPSIALTPANLDLAVAGGGFGGLAFALGGGSIANANT